MYRTRSRGRHRKATKEQKLFTCQDTTWKLVDEVEAGQVEVDLLLSRTKGAGTFGAVRRGVFGFYYGSSSNVDGTND